MKNNIDLVQQSISELSVDVEPSSSPKKLDPAFLAELEKHLGEKEASKNTNANGASISNNTAIPMLRPPPQSVKPKSPNTDIQQQRSFNFPNKVQNNWQTPQSKSTNVQPRPRSTSSDEWHNAPSNVDTAYQQQFPSLPIATNNARSNSSTVPRPASIAGTQLNEQVYAELRQTVPNLDQLTQNEFNTLYNKTVRQNILRSYQANSTALASAACNSMVS